MKHEEVADVLIPWNSMTKLETILPIISSSPMIPPSQNPHYSSLEFLVPSLPSVVRIFMTRRGLCFDSPDWERSEIQASEVWATLWRPLMDMRIAGNGRPTGPVRVVGNVM